MHCSNRRDRGFSLLELLIVMAIIVTIILIALPNYRNIQMTSHETSAIASLKAYENALVSYQSNYHTYPKNQSDMGPTQNGIVSMTAAGVLHSDLAPAGASSAVKDGYTFRYTAGAADPNGVILTYTINADPQSYNHTGVKSFFTDEGGVIHVTTDGTKATANSPELK
jgi:type IV pilus assembly protein PilA